MSKPRLTPLVRIISGLLIAGTFASGAAAQTGEEETFVDLGRWVIVQDEARRSCELRLTDGGQDILRYQMQDGRAGSIALQRRSGRYFAGMVGDVEWAFDDVRFAGFSSSGGFALGAGSRDVEAGFRSARTLTVSQGGQQIARIDLKTSSAGLRLLKQCAQQWRYIPWYRRNETARYRELPDTVPSQNGRMTAGPSRPVPHSGASSTVRSRPGGVAPPLEPSPASASTLTTPLKARAISPSSWIRDDDRLPWPSRGFREGQGVLRYTLLVNEDGRAEECDVEASTGSRKFDRRACKLLVERARFEPARGPNGEAVEARFTASVRFAGE